MRLDLTKVILVEIRDTALSSFPKYGQRRARDLLQTRIQQSYFTERGTHWKQIVQHLLYQRYALLVYWKERNVQIFDTIRVYKYFNIQYTAPDG